MRLTCWPRGYPPEKVELVRRWFHGEITVREYWPIFLRIGDAYSSGPGWPLIAHYMIHGGWRAKVRPAAFIHASRNLLNGWSVVDRLGEITAPTLVIAGRDDFVFPPGCQQQLAAGIPDARLRLIDHAGHNSHDEQSTEVMKAVRDFLSTPMTETP